MLIGDVQRWVDNFASFDDRFLERVAAAWPECMAVLPEQPEEDDITINLVDRLGKDVVVRRLCHWVEYQFEPFGLATDGSKYSKGIIDIAVLFDWDRERYLGPVDKLDSQSLRDVIQDSFCGGYLGAVADGGCRVGIL